MKKATALALSLFIFLFQIQPLLAEDTSLSTTQPQTTIESINTTQNLTTAEVAQNSLIQQNIDAQNSVQPPTLAELASSTALSQDTINTIINNVAAVGMDRAITYMTTNENQARYEAFIQSLTKSGGLDNVKSLIAAIKADLSYKAAGATTTTLSGWVNSNTNTAISSLFRNSTTAMDDYLVRFIKENLADAEAITNSLTKTGAAILKDKARGNVYSLYTLNGSTRYMRAEAGYWGDNNLTGMYQLYTHYGANNGTLTVFYNPTSKSANYKMSGGGVGGLDAYMNNVANPFDILGNFATYFSGNYYDRAVSLLSSAVTTSYTNMATYTGVLKVVQTTTSTSLSGSTGTTPTNTTNTLSSIKTSGLYTPTTTPIVSKGGLAIVIEDNGDGKRTIQTFQLGRIFSRTVEYATPTSIWVADGISSIGKLFDDAIRRAADAIRNLITNKETSAPTLSKSEAALKSATALDNMKDVTLKATAILTASLGAAASYLTGTLANIGRALTSLLPDAAIFSQKGGLFGNLFSEEGALNMSKGSLSFMMRMAVASQLGDIGGVVGKILENLVGLSKPTLKESGENPDDLKNVKLNRIIQAILGENIVVSTNSHVPSDNSAVKHTSDSVTSRIASTSSARTSDTISSTFTLQEDGNASSSFKKPVAVKMSEIVAVMGSRKPGLHGNNMLFLLPVAIRFGEKLIKRVFVVTGTLG